MKKLNALLASLLVVTSLHAQEIVPEVFTQETERLSVEEIKQEKKTFYEFITRYRSSEFVGHTQYVLSALNLSLRANVKYSLELDGSILFQLATDGNRYVQHSDVTFPMQGSVLFELKDKSGTIVNFRTEDGDLFEMNAKKGHFYILENEKSFNVRKNVQSKYNHADKPVGRFLAMTRFDLFSQDIEFYELLDGVLYRRGSFNGNAAPARRSW